MSGGNRAGQPIQLIVVNGSNQLVGNGYNFPLAAWSANTAALVGDSHTSHWTGNTATTADRYQQGWPFWMQTLGGHRFNIISDQSQGGTYITPQGPGNNFRTQMTAAIASGARHIFIMGGLNDAENPNGWSNGVINALPNNTPVPISQVQAAWYEHISRGLQAGAHIWILTQAPLYSGWSGYTVARQAQNMAMNEWLRAFAYAVNSSVGRDAVTVIDTAKAATNGLSATGDLLAGAGGYQGDDHYNNYVAYYMGKEAARVTGLVVPDIPLFRTSAGDNYGYSTLSRNIFDNGFFTANAGGVATGLTMSTGGGASSTNTIGARSDGLGNYQQQAVTATADGDFARWQCSDQHARIADGDTFFAICQVSVSAGSIMPKNLRLLLSATCSTVSKTSTWGQLDSGSTSGVPHEVALPESFVGTYKTPEITYNAASMGTMTSLVTQFTSFAKSGGTYTVQSSLFDMRKVPVI